MIQVSSLWGNLKTIFPQTEVVKKQQKTPKPQLSIYLEVDDMTQAQMAGSER